MVHLPSFIHYRGSLLLLGASALLSAATSFAKPVVHATNYPLSFFAEQIGGDDVAVRFLPGSQKGDPAFWKPTVEAIQQLQAADLVLLNGATYEKWLFQVSLPRRVQVDTSSAFSSETIKVEDAVTHSHGKGGKHTHKGTAITTWLDFVLAKKQAEAVRDALIPLLPGSESDLRERSEPLFEAIGKLHVRMEDVSQRIGDQPLMGSHPVYQYLSRRYGLDIASVHWEPGTPPDEKEKAELKKLLKDHPARWMIWEGTPSPASVEFLQSLEIESVVFDPCGNVPSEGDWLQVMRENVERLETIAGS